MTNGITGECPSIYQRAYQLGKKTVQKTATGASAIVSETDSYRKIWQIVKGIIDLVGSFTDVRACSPIVNAVKVIGVTVGGFDFIGRIKEWVVPDKNGATLANKHWAKIISRIYLTFANIIDFIRMLKFFKVFEHLRLGAIASQMSKVYFFRVIIDHFPALDLIKPPLIAFSAMWNVLDVSIVIHGKRKYLAHAQSKLKNWKNLSERSFTRQQRYLEERVVKYSDHLYGDQGKLTGNRETDDLSKELTKEEKKAISKLSKGEQKKVKNRYTTLPKLRKMLDKAQDADLSVAHKVLSDYSMRKVKKWEVKISNIRIDFAKSGIGIACEVAKIAVVTLAFGLALSVGGWALLPPVIVVLGLASNSFSLSKFLIDKLVMHKVVPKVTVPRASSFT
ncbi:MAG: hypothetical protein ACSNEK_07705 [Parachlamydiaceae bacterium]